MNRRSREVIIEFASKENKALLATLLIRYFNNSKVYRFVEKNIDDFVAHFIHTIQQDLYMSDPLPTITVRDQVKCYNDQFLRDRIAFIKVHVIGDEVATKYMVTDGLPTSRRTPEQQRQISADVLQSWYVDSGRPVQARDDREGKTCNTYYGYNDQLQTGVTFCDQSELNTSQHLSQLMDSSYIVALNREVNYTNDAFGNATPNSDARLLQRRVFNTNEGCRPNGIPRYEQRLYKRFYERDIDETLRNTERDTIVRGYDMRELRDRVDYKNKPKARFEPGVKDRSKMYLGVNTEIFE